MMQKEVDAQKHIETYKSLISISVELYKALLLLNGGGLIALLTYIGSSHSARTMGAAFSSSIYLFICGIALVPISFTLSYGVQLGIYKRFLNPQHNGTRDRRIDTQYFGAIILTVLSIACFVAGSMIAAHNLLFFKHPQCFVNSMLK